MFFSGVLLPVFFGLCLLVDNPAPLLILLTVFLAGVSIVLYDRFFSEELPATRSRQTGPPSLESTGSGTALPPASNIEMNGVSGRSMGTAELVQPPSVTEHTTKLLDSDSRRDDPPH